MQLVNKSVSCVLKSVMEKVTLMLNPQSYGVSFVATLVVLAGLAAMM